MNSLKSNIWKLHVIQVLRWFLTAIPILVIFYQSHGLTMQQILIIQSAFAATTLILEIPSGYMADLAGRKFCLIFGLVLWSLAWGLYSVSNSFTNFLNAEIILAMGSSLISGCDTALLYDTLKNLDRSDEYKQLQGKQTAIWHFSEGTASIVGAGLASLSLLLPFYTQAVVALLAIPFALSLTEPAKAALDTTTGKVKSLLKIVKSTLHENKELRWLIIYNATISSFCIALLWFMQPRFQAAGVPLKYFGILWATTLFISGISSHYAHRIEEYFGKKTILKALMPVLAISLLLFGSLPAALGLFTAISIYIVRGLNIPIFMDYINQLISSEARATVISINAMVMRTMFAVLGPLLGFLNDAYSFQTAFLLAGSTLLVIYFFIQFKSKYV